MVGVQLLQFVLSPVVLSLRGHYLAVDTSEVINCSAKQVFANPSIYHTCS
jgi:hypothetical protein